MEFFEKLGIDWRLLVWQLVNFIILFGVLTKLLYKPILKLLDERTEKIAKGIRDAETASLARQKGEEERNQIVREARKEAQKIIETARVDGEKTKAEILKTIQRETDKILVQAKSNIEAAKQEMVGEVKSQAAVLVASALEKVLNKTMTAAIDQKIVSQAVKEVSQK